MRPSSWALTLSALVACGCNAGTSVLVTIDPATLSAQGFTLAVALGDGRHVSAELAGRQPASAVVLLDPVAQSVTASATAHLGGAGDPTVTRTIEAVPHRQVALTLRFDGSAAADLAVVDDLAAAPLDLARAADVATAPDLTTPTPPPPPDMTTFLARDTFVRPDQPLWGTASDGQVWASDANTASNFSIAGDAGLVTNTGTSSLQAVLGPATITDADVRVQIALAVVDQSQNGGPVIRRVDGANFYKAYLDGTLFVLQKRLTSTYSVLQQVSFAATAGQYYWIRFQVLGTTLRAKAWPVGGSEPASWMLQQTDSSLTMGNVGLRMQANGAASVSFREFMAQ